MRFSAPTGYGEERESSERALRMACAVLGDFATREIETGDASHAYGLLALQRQTMGAMLGHALDRQAWTDAEDIARALDRYWHTRGLRGEAAAWADRILDAAAGSDEIPAQALWLYAISNQAMWHMAAGRPDQAERNCRQVLDYLQDRPETDGIRKNIAITYHQLGIVAQECAQLDKAEDWYRKSLTVSGELGDHQRLAGTYHQLSVVALFGGRLDEAEDWSRKALAINEELGDQARKAASYHQLAMIAQDRGQPDLAEERCYQALAIMKRSGDLQGQAIIYHQLGVITLQDYRQLDQAEEWFRESLAVKEDLADRPGMAVSYGVLGELAERRGQPELALSWYIRCVTLFGEFPSPYTRTAPSDLARLAGQLGMPVVAAAWLQVTSQPLPEHVRDYLTHSTRDDLRGGTP